LTLSIRRCGDILQMALY